MRVLALTWNLYHGRSPDPAGRSLLNEFAAALAGWEWDVALLQEVPPWWPPLLAARGGRAVRGSALTSRNFGLWLRREISVRNPDVLKSNGGGANAILVRGAIREHRIRAAVAAAGAALRPRRAARPTARGWSTCTPRRPRGAGPAGR